MFQRLFLTLAICGWTACPAFAQAFDFGFPQTTGGNFTTQPTWQEANQGQSAVPPQAGIGQTFMTGTQGTNTINGSIGGYRSAGSDISYPFYGLIDNARLYTKALSSAEITDLQGSGSNRQGYTTTNYAGKALARVYISGASAAVTILYLSKFRFCITPSL